MSFLSKIDHTCPTFGLALAVLVSVSPALAVLVSVGPALAVSVSVGPALANNNTNNKLINNLL